MNTLSPAGPAELTPLLDLTARIGRNPLLTQGSTGNTSAKLAEVLWIKASGKWMADVADSSLLVPLDLSKITECLSRSLDPADQFPGASLETAMHAVIPHRIVVHVHSVETIAWAVRSDAPVELARRLNGLHWQWVPYVASGLPLACEVEKALRSAPEADVFVLGNHGLVIGGEDCRRVEELLIEVERRLAVSPRPAHPADYSALADLALDSEWDLPDDDGVHVLAMDAISQAVLGGGMLYPCQTIFSESRTPELFRPIPYPHPNDAWQLQYRRRPFLIARGRGVVVNRSMTAAECAMLSGLASVVQRIPASAPLRYLSEAEIASTSGVIAQRYRKLANARSMTGWASGPRDAAVRDQARTSSR